MGRGEGKREREHISSSQQERENLTEPELIPALPRAKESDSQPTQNLTTKIKHSNPAAATDQPHTSADETTSMRWADIVDDTQTL
jgi:hypothetical protein